MCDREGDREKGGGGRVQRERVCDMVEGGGCLTERGVWGEGV